jgi:hypothetical protein
VFLRELTGLRPRNISHLLTGLSRELERSGIQAQSIFDRLNHFWPPGWAINARYLLLSGRVPAKRSTTGRSWSSATSTTSELSRIFSQYRSHPSHNVFSLWEKMSRVEHLWQVRFRQGMILANHQYRSRSIPKQTAGDQVGDG